MPIYEYACVQCGNIDEHFMRMSDPDPTSCSKCSGEVRKKISSTSFSLKGEGWYVTDYKNKPTESKETVPESVASASENKTAASEKSVDSKPAQGDKVEKPVEAEKSEKKSSEIAVKTEATASTKSVPTVKNSLVKPQ